VRLTGLALSDVELNVDEAQYWEWSREFAFGYFSKPPLIAWIIAASTGVCGDGEACIRASAPLFYAGTSVAVYAAALALYGRAVALLAGLTTLFAVAVVFSARIISTDVPLLFFWSLALLAYVKRLRGGGWPWLVLLAVSFGLGLLAKYAMAYFVLGVLTAGLFSPAARRLLRDPGLWLTFAAGALALVPNIYWNTQNQFATVHHLGENVAGGGADFSLEEALEFLSAQFAVAGPIVFGALIVALVRFRRTFVEETDRVLLGFTLPALVLVGGLAFITETNPNWAAVSYISAMIVIPAILHREGRERLAVAGIFIGVVFQAILLVADPLADRLHIDAFGIGNPFAETMGMRHRAERVRAAAAATGVTTVVPQSRRDLSGLTYYLRHDPLAIRAWPRTEGPAENYFEQKRVLAAPFPERLLVTADCPNLGRYAALYRQAELLQTLTYRHAPPKKKPDHLILLTEPTGVIDRPGHCD
jgi:4-amino-4-deoxy-L-arabinose transferase-like glycosyltransferase